MKLKPIGDECNLSLFYWKRAGPIMVKLQNIAYKVLSGFMWKIKLQEDPIESYQFDF